MNNQKSEIQTKNKNKNLDLSLYDRSIFEDDEPNNISIV
jgi:hypothetical protein